MAIKDLYKEVESEKKNKPYDKKMVSIPMEDFCEEHKRLIKVLKEGTREELLAEAKKQEEDLEEYAPEEEEEED